MFSSVHIISQNIGDNLCAPIHYFDFDDDYTEIDIRKPENLDNVAPTVIVGGGGLLSGFSVKSLEKLIRMRNDGRIKKLIAWGVGFNIHYGNKANKSIYDFVKRCDLIGIRDNLQVHNWVPCVSCMSPYLDIEYEIKQDVVIYDHKDVPINIFNIKHMDNSNLDLKEVIAFLGSANIVVTNSYHGVYWSTLLGKKVLTIPFSSRFDNIKHPPVVCNESNWNLKVKDAVQYPHALAECRDATLKFKRKVDDLIY